MRNIWCSTTIGIFCLGVGVCSSQICHATTSAASGGGAQAQSQESAAQVKDQGAKDAQNMALMQFAAGAAMIAAGASTPDYGLVAAGVMMLMQGMMSSKASKKMGQDAAIGSLNKNDLQSGITPLANTQSSGSSVGIANADLRSGKIGQAMDKFEKAAGISRDALVQGLEAGKSPYDILKNSKLGLADKDLKKAMSTAQASLASNPNAGKDVAEKMGFPMGGSSAAAEGSGLALTSGASGGNSSASKNTFDDFFSSLKGKEEELAGGLDGLNANLGNLSPEVRASLEKNGVTDKTLFQMVHSQYSKNLPVMFGMDAPKFEGSPVATLPDAPVDNVRVPASTTPPGI